MAGIEVIFPIIGLTISVIGFNMRNWILVSTGVLLSLFPVFFIGWFATGWGNDTKQAQTRLISSATVCSLITFISSYYLMKRIT